MCLRGELDYLLYLLEKLNVQVSEWGNSHRQPFVQTNLLKRGAVRRKVPCMKCFRLSDLSRI